MDCPTPSLGRANDTFLISREIGIDAGHRVLHHQSKCRNFHGHRYTIQAWCRGPLYLAGEQSGMVLDFGFLKEEMMSVIDAVFDHSFMFSIEDELCREMFDLCQPPVSDLIEEQVSRGEVFHGTGRGGMKICVLPGVPTAEYLASFWFGLLDPRVADRSGGQARLVRLKVWETPNCWAAYGPELQD